MERSFEWVKAGSYTHSFGDSFMPGTVSDVNALDAQLKYLSVDMTPQPIPASHPHPPFFE